MFRRRFWVSLALSVPVIFFSEFIQDVFGYTAPTFPGSVWITPVLSVIIFAYGGVPFLSMARTELENREPGMMMLISLAITVSFVYSIGSLFLEGTTPFFWELVTLIDIMLLGHWMEMRSVRQASGARSTNWRNSCLTPPSVSPRAGIPRKYPFPNSAKTMSYSSVRARACLPTAKSSKASRPSTSR